MRVRYDKAQNPKSWVPFPSSRTDRTSRRLSPMTSVGLFILWYQESSEYTDIFLARINALQLHIFEVISFHQLVSTFTSSSVFRVDFVQLGLLRKMKALPTVTSR